MYIPSVRNVPLFEEKGDAQAEATVSTNSLYFDAAYAFSDSYAFSLGTNTSYGTFSNSYDMLMNIIPLDGH
jgi:hypothetical protein